MYRPYPVVGVITPWNFPFAMPGLDVIPALAAGAAVLLKPSEVTPLSAVEFVRGWTEIGAPPVLALATGYGETGAAVVANVDYVQFTGSTATGRIVARQCAERLIPYSLELGGKDPALVLADADLDRAANGIAWGGLFNSGQVCISIERVYVEEPVYDEFLAKLVKNVRELRQGQDDRSFKFDIGAMATVAQRDIVQRHVDEARGRGCSGRDRRQADRCRHVLRADRARRRRAVDGRASRGDIRADPAGGEGRRRSRSDPAGQRLRLRAVGVGMDQR